MPTLSDVARRAGVSVSVVSRIMNSDPQLRVRPETRERVLRIAEQMHYTANFAGRALRLSRSGALALIVPDVNNAIFAELMRGVEDEADAVNYIVLLGRAERIQPGDDMLRRLIGEGRVDGALLQRRDDLDDPALRQLMEHDVPVVLVNSAAPRLSTRHNSVTVDDTAGAELATRHLIELGHRRIGMLSGVPTSDTARRREKGFRQSLHDAGLRQRTEWIRRLGYTAASGRTALAEVMTADRRPTALLVANVNAAIGALAAARELGVDVPGELSIVSYHDDWVAEHTWPPLTAVRMPLYEMGRAAVKALLHQLSGGTPTELVVSDPAPVLTIRSSTAPPS
jgi:LacI family transcriptional regulator